MKKSIPVYLIIYSFITLISCNSDPSTNEITKEIIESNNAMSELKRGEYLVKIIGCDHCHTPKKMTEHGPVPDTDKWLMGFPADQTLPDIPKDAFGPGKWTLFNGDLTAAVGPWGVSFSANLTPSESGLANWTYENFRESMTNGKHKGMEGTRMVLPPMPWQSYKGIEDKDLKAIYAYLKSIKPIDNVVPSPVSIKDL